MLCNFMHNTLLTHTSCSYVKKIEGALNKRIQTSTHFSAGHQVHEAFASFFIVHLYPPSFGGNIEKAVFIEDTVIAINASATATYIAVMLVHFG